jgi:hypothetical protein
MGKWVHKESLERGFANELSRYIYNQEGLGKIYLPNLKESDNLYLFSDYSYNSEQQLIAYSILITDNESFISFKANQKFFWEESSLDVRVIEYKKLNDQIRRKALSPFLHFCNNINGLVLTILFNKSTKSIFQTERPKQLENQMKVWKSEEIQEKFLRLREIIIAMLNGLSRQSQKICWITDNDDIVANDSQLRAANEILKQTFDKYLDFKIGGCELKTTSMDSPDSVFEKLCSLTDLCAGGLVDFIGDYEKQNLIGLSSEILNPIDHSKDKVNPITNWLSKNEEGNMLKKITIEIRETDINNLLIQAYRFPEFMDGVIVS